MKINQTYYWPAWYRKTLKQSEKSLINTQLAKQLGRANLYLWRAYNIYDDIADTGNGRDKLPEANDCHRKFLEIYYRLNLKPTFYNLFDAVMKDLEKANREEISQNRIRIHDGHIIYPARWPDFSNLTDLSRKSLALSLGPIAIQAVLNKAYYTTRVKRILNFFRSALAAKQLADDAADWFDDLENGSITAANILILKKAKKKKISLDLNNHPEVAYSLFITDAAGQISADLQLLCKKARMADDKLFRTKNSRLAESILAPLEKSIAIANERRSSSLKNYGKML